MSKRLIRVEQHCSSINIRDDFDGADLNTAIAKLEHLKRDGYICQLSSFEQRTNGVHSAYILVPRYYRIETASEKTARIAVEQLRKTATENKVLAAAEERALYEKLKVKYENLDSN
jgi:hypothetical protein